MRDSIETFCEMFAGVGVCPGDWVEEYTGYIVGNLNGRLRAEFACVDFNPDALQHHHQGGKGSTHLAFHDGKQPGVLCWFILALRCVFQMRILKMWVATCWTCIYYYLSGMTVLLFFCI
ncbi:hypothetical protein CEXT_524321 [Caerostris extrusa]|uniref:Uncharacterized protein n=1 Tax=Caerostris extrusa TaxID=172846 RepID=A0AAV4MDY8_CAEEX|nr:hypothetical protein CEXT_524321 [Caerostris extrusa]